MSEVLNLAGYKFAPLDRLLRNFRSPVAHPHFATRTSCAGRSSLSPEGIQLLRSGRTRASRRAAGRAARRARAGGCLRRRKASAPEQPFTRMLVKIKKEIISPSGSMELIRRADGTTEKIPARTLKQWLDEGRAVTLLHDTRNDYEIRLGHFSRRAGRWDRSFSVNFPECREPAAGRIEIANGGHVLHGRNSLREGGAVPRSWPEASKMLFSARWRNPGNISRSVAARISRVSALSLIGGWAWTRTSARRNRCFASIARCRCARTSSATCATCPTFPARIASGVMPPRRRKRVMKTALSRRELAALAGRHDGGMRAPGGLPTRRTADIAAHPSAATFGSAIGHSRWQRPCTRLIEKRLDGIVLLAGEIVWPDAGARVIPATIQWDTVRRLKKPVSLGLPRGALPGSIWGSTMLRFAPSEKSPGVFSTRRTTKGVTITEFQLDFDCAQRKLGGYRKMASGVAGNRSPDEIDHHGVAFVVGGTRI